MTRLLILESSFPMLVMSRLTWARKSIITSSSLHDECIRSDAFVRLLGCRFRLLGHRTRVVDLDDLFVYSFSEAVMSTDQLRLARVLQQRCQERFVGTAHTPRLIHSDAPTVD